MLPISAMCTSIERQLQSPVSFRVQPRRLKPSIARLYLNPAHRCLVVCLQYNMVSAWVPAKFSAPKLLPDIPAWFSRGSKKTGAETDGADKPAFRQVWPVNPVIRWLRHT